MGRPSKQKVVQPGPAPSLSPESKPAPGETPPAVAETGEPTRRIEVRLDASGRIQPMRPETREELLRALKASPEALGEEYQPRPAAGFVDEALAARMLDALAVAQSFVFSRTAKLPYEKAAEVMRFDVEEKKTLAPPTSALLNQYAGAWLARHGVLVEFSVKFGAVELGKFDRAVALAREAKKVETK